MSPVTVDSLTAALWTAYDGAVEDRAWSAAVEALDTLARLHGLMLERREVTIRREDEATG